MLDSSFGTFTSLTVLSSELNWIVIRAVILRFCLACRGHVSCYWGFKFEGLILVSQLVNIFCLQRCSSKIFLIVCQSFFACGFHFDNLENRWIKRTLGAVDCHIPLSPRWLGSYTYRCAAFVTLTGALNSTLLRLFCDPEKWHKMSFSLSRWPPSTKSGFGVWEDRRSSWQKLGCSGHLSS